MYLPLYNENIGLGGFKCDIVTKDGKICGRVCRTEKGIKSHCWLRHGQKVQREFNFEGQAEPNELVRVSDGADGSRTGHPSDATSGGGTDLPGTASDTKVP